MQALTEREKILQLYHNQEFRNYRIISKENILEGDIAKPIGEGGSGIVYLAEQEFIENINVKRAIKFFVFRDDIGNPESSGRISEENFKVEIVNISSFN